MEEAPTINLFEEEPPPRRRHHYEGRRCDSGSRFVVLQPDGRCDAQSRVDLAIFSAGMWVSDRSQSVIRPTAATSARATRIPHENDRTS